MLSNGMAIPRGGFMILQVVVTLVNRIQGHASDSISVISFEQAWCKPYIESFSVTT